MGRTGFGNWIDRDGKLVLLEKSVRTVPYGFLGVIYGVYLAQLGFSAFAIGIVLTLTVLSSAFYTFIISFVADRIGRRRTLVFFALTDFVAGTLLFVSTDWWAPVLAGIVGNMTVGAGEVGPFLSLEQAILPRTARADRRTLAFSLYNLVGYGASSAGALLAGLPRYAGYPPLFLAYVISVSERIARRIGLLRTMVFTHMPSNVFLIGVAFAPTPLTAVFLLLCRQSLSQMDVPARQSYVMAIVDESDRTAAAGLTSTTRTVSSSISPSLAGYALANLWSGVPLVAAGILKLAYDALIYKEFRQVRPPEERGVDPK